MGIKKILIIEDEISLLEILANKFNKEGFKIFIAEDGVAGLDIAFKERPDIILLDIIMPRMDGMTMLNKLRQDKWGAKALVIILSNLNDRENIGKGIESGAFEFLIKSDWLIKEDLVKKVKNKLNIRLNKVSS